MQRLEASGVVRLIYRSLGVKGLIFGNHVAIKEKTVQFFAVGKLFSFPKSYWHFLVVRPQTWRRVCLSLTYLCSSLPQFWLVLLF